MTQTARKVIPFMKKEDLETMVKDLEFLSGYNFMKKFDERKDSEKYDSYENRLGISNVISEGKEADLVMNETNTGIDEAMIEYFKQKNESVKEPIERQKEFLIDNYYTKVGEILGKLAERERKKEVKGDLTQEEKDIYKERVVEENVYSAVGTLLAELTLNEDYDKDISDAHKRLKEILKLKPEEKEEYARNLAMEMWPLPMNARNWRVQYKDSLPQWVAEYSRKLGKRFVKKSGNSYGLDRDELEKAFYNNNSYMDMTSMVDIEKLAKRLVKE